MFDPMAPETFKQRMARRVLMTIAACIVGGAMSLVW